MGFGGAGSTPGGSTGASYPGMTGQYGGSGVYGGETYDARRAAEKAVQEANDRAADLDHTVQQNQKRIDDLRTQIAQVGVSTKTGALGRPIARTPDEQKQDEEKQDTQRPIGRGHIPIDCFAARAKRTGQQHN
jgi:hypothetical protein